MATTTNGVPYPAGTDAADVPYWNQQLAQKVDDEALAGWVDFSPNVYTAMSTTPSSIAKTINLARYKKIGHTVWAVVDVTVNATTTGGVGVSLPFTARDRLQSCGSCGIFGTSTPSDQSGIAYMNGDKTKIVPVAYTNGFRDATSGHVVRYSVVFEVS